MLILSIESSCDETSAAVVADGRIVLSNIIASQIDLHAVYGGVVPEVASRAHIEAIGGIVSQALETAGVTISDIEAVGVTYAPGLIGALLVGVSYAKGLAYSHNLPLIPVHHIKGHIAANYLSDTPPEPPFLAFVASGGHTSIIRVKDYPHCETVARTRDDAAGEAFDKIGRAMGLAYPAGREIDELARSGDPSRYPFPNSRIEGNPQDFTFSGVKTHAINLIHNLEQRGEKLIREDLAASFTKCVIRSIEDRLEMALNSAGLKTLVCAGGVMANSHIRSSIADMCTRMNVALHIPPLSLCGDNAAMIGAQAYHEYTAGNTSGLDLNARATLRIEETP